MSLLRCCCYSVECLGHPELLYYARFIKDVYHHWVLSPFLCYHMSSLLRLRPHITWSQAEQDLHCLVGSSVSLLSRLGYSGLMGKGTICHRHQSRCSNQGLEHCLSCFRLQQVFVYPPKETETTARSRVWHV